MLLSTEYSKLSKEQPNITMCVMNGAIDEGIQDKLHEAIVNLDQGRVESNVRLPSNIHGPGDAQEIMAVEKLALEDEAVMQEIAKLELPKGTAIISDPWIYGKQSHQLSYHSVRPETLMC